MTTATGLSPAQIKQRIKTLTATRERLKANLADTNRQLTAYKAQLKEATATPAAV
jgi:prefoldin subunit 5